MSIEGFVGSFGLTFFCNKCVEMFYKFKKEGVFTEELEIICDRAILAFRSLKWPIEPNVPTIVERTIFNTIEEIESLERVISAQNEKFDNTTLDKWIGKLQSILDENIPLEEKKQVAKELQKFFDTLGDYSFYASKEALRSLDGY